MAGLPRAGSSVGDLDDLDDFKTVNDTYGHAAGDQLLAAFGQHVRESIRPEDTAARLGGDEFAVLCEDTTPEEAAGIVERLTGGSWTNRPPHLTTGAETGTEMGVQVWAGVSVGVATSPGSRGRYLNAEELLHEADGAMYAAKARSRG